jgi:proteasome accessory factor B
MPERITKLQRWIDLVADLVGRRVPVPFEELVKAVPAYWQQWEEGDATAQASVHRMFERDKHELRRHGIPIQTVRYSINLGSEQIDGYRIPRRDFYLPYLRLIEEATHERGGGAVSVDSGASPTKAHVRFRDTHRIAEVEISREEAGLALEALRRVADVPSFPLATEARGAFRKLAFDLDPAPFGSGAPVLYVERPETSELLERLRMLCDALLARKRVTFRYYGIYRGADTLREVEPYGLLFQHGHWYLIGYDCVREAVRVFRAERMDDIVVNRRSPNKSDFEVQAGFRLDAYRGREAWELGAEDEPPVRARVMFRWPASLAAERNRQGTALETRADGSVIRGFDVHQVHPFLRWLLSLEGDAAIVDPPELAMALRDLAADVAVAHGARVERSAGGSAGGSTGDAAGRPKRRATKGGRDV